MRNQQGSDAGNPSEGEASRLPVSVNLNIKRILKSLYFELKIIVRQQAEGGVKVLQDTYSIRQYVSCLVDFLRILKATRDTFEVPMVTHLLRQSTVIGRASARRPPIFWQDMPDGSAYCWHEEEMDWSTEKVSALAEAGSRVLSRYDKITIGPREYSLEEVVRVFETNEMKDVMEQLELMTPIKELLHLKE